MKKKRLKIFILFFLGVGFIYFLYSLTKGKTAFPDFKCITLNGDTLSRKDLVGKVTVINIWATWCASCVEEIPSLNQVYDKYKDDKNVIFLAITDESKEKIIKFLTQQEFKYIHITDDQELIGKLQTGIFKIRPMHILVNQQGLIVEEKNGGDNISTYLIENIEKYKPK